MKRFINLMLVLLMGLIILWSPIFCLRAEAGSWVEDGKRYKENGVYLTGFQIIDGKQYYFNHDGYLKKKGSSSTDIYTIEDIEYYFYEDNSCVKLSEYSGIVKDYKKRYIYVSGNKVNGWYQFDGYWYYASNYLVKTGDVKISDIICHFDDEGRFISSDEEFEKVNLPSTTNPQVIQYSNTSCGITASEWNSRTTYGWNLGNSLSSCYGDWDKTRTTMLNQETMWGNPKVNKELIDYVKSLGFNSIRIPVTFYMNAYQSEDGHYHINQDWLYRVAEVVQMALDNDMTVYLCPMCDSLNDGPIRLLKSEEEMKDVYTYCHDMWQDIAEYFKYYDGRLAFESYNEVWSTVGGKTVYTKQGHEQMNYINQLFVDTVRATGAANSDRVLICSSYGHEYDYGALNDFVVPKDAVKDRIMASVHVYVYNFDQSLESTMIQIEDFMRSKGIPVIINEWGVTNNSYLKNKQIREYFYSNFSYYADKHNIKTYVWDNGKIGDLGLIQRRNYSHSEISYINAIVNPKPVNSASSVVMNECNSESFQLAYRMKKDYSAIEYHPWWGYTVFGGLDKGYEIPDGSKYFFATIMKHTTDLKAIRYESVYYYFYDSNNNYITFKKNSKNGIMFEIPENAKYVYVSCCNRFDECKSSEIVNWFSSGQLQFYATFVNGDLSNLTYGQK